jgi:hypothetical protein
MGNRSNELLAVVAGTLLYCSTAVAVDLPLSYVDGSAAASSEASATIVGGLPDGTMNEFEEQETSVSQYAEATSSAGGAIAIAQISVDAEDLSGAYVSDLTSAMLQQASVSFASGTNSGRVGTYGGCTVRRTVRVENDPTLPVFESGTLVTTLAYSAAFASNLGAGGDNRYTVYLRCGGSFVYIDSTGDDAFFVNIHIERIDGDYDVTGSFNAAGLGELGTTFQGSKIVGVGEEVEMLCSTSGELHGIVSSGTRSGDINISSYVTAHVVGA